MSYGSRQAFIVNHTLRLSSIAGKIVETKNPELFVQAKGVARNMAEELNMPEAIQDIQPLVLENIIEACQRLIVNVGCLSKACEALDHLEDFPFRRVLEENIREILRL